MSMHEERIPTNVRVPYSVDIGVGLSQMQDQGQQEGQVPDIRLVEPTFMEVFIAWEKLRLLYNGILLIICLSMVLKAGFAPFALIFLADSALLANRCFCAGPVTEGYLRLAGFAHKASRWVLFCLGSLIAIACVMECLPGMLQKLDK